MAYSNAVYFMQGICKFFVKRSERGNFDPNKPYPFAKKSAKELYPEITADDIKVTEAVILLVCNICSIP